MIQWIVFKMKMINIRKWFTHENAVFYEQVWSELFTSMWWIKMMGAVNENVMSFRRLDVLHLI